MKASHLASAIEPSPGFSLIELMIVLAIGALLAAIALPMYTKQVQHSRRVEARTALLDIAGREERYLSVSGSYTTLPANLGYAAGAPAFPMAVGSGYYQVNVAVAVPAARQPADVHRVRDPDCRLESAQRPPMPVLQRRQHRQAVLVRHRRRRRRYFGHLLAVSWHCRLDGGA